MIKNDKIQLIIMDIIQSDYSLSNKNNGAELMFLFNICLLRLIIKLTFIFNENLLVLRIKMVNHQMRGHDHKTIGGHVF